MERAFLETLFLCGIVLLIILQIIYLQNYREDSKILYSQTKKRAFLVVMIFGYQVVPILYLLSVDFIAPDYHLWKWVGILSLLFFIFLVWVFMMAVKELGNWWLPGQELKEDLELVKTGVYKYVRHPMYAALAGMALCQLLMIQNWLAGPISLFTILPFCIYQIKREERLLIRFFGDDYRQYIRETGMIWPREKDMPFLLRLLKKQIASIRFDRKEIMLKVKEIYLLLPGKSKI
jgi:protein-S-isoprenylcysteine O-methyltransferase Ste14